MSDVLAHAPQSLARVLKLKKVEFKQLRDCNFFNGILKNFMALLTSRNITFCSTNEKNTEKLYLYKMQTLYALLEQKETRASKIECLVRGQKQSVLIAFST